MKARVHIKRNEIADTATNLTHRGQERIALPFSFDEMMYNFHYQFTEHWNNAWYDAVNRDK